MIRHRLVLLVTLAFAAGALTPGRPIFGTARAQLPTLQISAAQLFFAGQPVDNLTVGAKVKRYTVEITGVGFDASARVLVNGMKIPVLSSTPNQMTARFKGLALTPGEVSLQVVNPDGETSNSVALEVISDASVLSISSLAPDTGTVGAQVTLTGVGFTPTGNMAEMISVVLPTLRGFAGPIDSPDGKTLTLEVPSGICPPCFFNNPPCLGPCFAVSAGSYHLSVSNANGLSNSVLFLVRSPLSITLVSPEVAPIGAQVTVTGEDFTPANNTIGLVKTSDPTVGGLITPLASADGKTLTFKVPDSLLPPCFLNGCKIANTPVSPGSYMLSVMNANGFSNSLTLLISSASGPIGVWGSTSDKVKVTVTDTEIMVEGLCFTGLIAQTLAPDAMGSFNLSGSFTPSLGPSALPQTAQYSGMISGATMTITITTSAGATIGPFTLTFGNDVLIVHPCA